MTLAAWAQAGREIAVIGLGRSGLSAGRLLRARGIPVYASDSGHGDPVQAAAQELEGLGAAVELGGHDLQRIAGAGGVVLSPGVPPDAAPVRAARDAGVTIRAEIDLGLEAIGRTPYVGVTGTNGKSTTTALVAHLLRAGGFRAEAVGNIGTPVAELALGSDLPEWLAIEFSSFQLHDTPLVAPVAGILTNLSPDHLDRYPSLGAYYADKRLFFRNANEASVWVGNADDAESAAMIASAPGRQLRFSVKAEADAWYDRPAEQLMLGTAPLIRRAEFPLLGDHNVANALAAALAVQAVAGIAVDLLGRALHTFRSLSHRLEIVREVAGVLWINDSKATNLGSTEVAVAAVDRPFVLLLGGRHKGASYRRLSSGLRDRCRMVIAYGEAREIVMADLAGVVPVESAGTFAEVLARAARAARPGDAVLLSPACSSWDMFTDYEERGRTFRALVEAM